MALRNKFRELKDNITAEQIHKFYLINDPCEQEDKKLKLLPQKEDREIYRSLILEDKISNKNHDMAKAVAFFSKALIPPKDSSLSTKEWLNRIYLKGIHRLVIVRISLGAEDNAYGIFESLNGKGLPLNQTDLLRNHSMMLFGNPDLQEKSSAESWGRIDQIFQTEQDKKIEQEFFRRWMISHGGKITKKAIYEKGKKIFDELYKKDQLLPTLKQIATIAPYFKAFTQKSDDQNISPKIQKAFDRMRHIGCSAASSAILILVERLLENPDLETEILSSLEIMESYFLRRDICGLTANAEDKVFSDLCTELRKDERDFSNISVFITEFLSSISGAGCWPSDTEFKKAFLNKSLTDINKKAGGGLSFFIISQIEKTLDEDISSKLKNTRLIPIFPEDPSADWKQKLTSEDIGDCKEHSLTFGNLALIKNDDFPHGGTFTYFNDLKRKLEKEPFKVNTDILAVEFWNYSAIEKKGEYFFNIARELWPYGALYNEEEAEIFTCQNHGVEAKGTKASFGRGWIILKGSKGISKISSEKYFQPDILARQELLHDGSLREDGDQLIFLKNVRFTSISAASRCLFGTSRTGPEDWVDINGKTYGDRKREGTL